MLMIMMMMTGLTVKMVLMIMRLVRVAMSISLSFKRHSNLENHPAYGKSKLRKEKFTLEDKAKLLFAKTCRRY